MSELGVPGLELDETLQVRGRMARRVAVMIREELYDLMLLVGEQDIQQFRCVFSEPDDQTRKHFNQTVTVSPARLHYNSSVESFVIKIIYLEFGAELEQIHYLACSFSFLWVLQ